VVRRDRAVTAGLGLYLDRLVWRNDSIASAEAQCRALLQCGQ
jgi:hypothetical protein